jgi:hypothetical protein
LSQSGAFKVFVSPNFLSYGKSLFVGDWFHLFRAESFGSSLIFSKIQLGADENDRNPWGVMFNFRIPLVLFVSVPPDYDWCL